MGLAAFNRMRRLQSESNEQEQVEAYEELERSTLEKVKNDDLKARLEQLEIEFDSKATKKDLIDLLIGEEEQEEGDDNEQGSSEEIDTEGQETKEEQEEEEVEESEEQKEE